MRPRCCPRVRPPAAGSLILAALLLLPASCAGPRRPVDTAVRPHARPRPSIDLAALERKIHALVNRERANRGLSRLAWDDGLAQIARDHSRDMALRGYFSHASPEGKDFSFRYQRSGYACQVRTGQTIHLGAENIALNHLANSVTTINGVPYPDWNSADRIAETTVQGWMDSPGHRRNILTPYWRREGVGIHVSPDDKVLITQNFC